MFNGFLMENGHFVSEECGPYRGSTNGDSCKFYQKCQPVAKISDSYFIETSQKENSVAEKKIMKEILYREIRRHASNEKQTTSENLNLSARYKS